VDRYVATDPLLASIEASVLQRNFTEAAVRLSGSGLVRLVHRNGTTYSPHRSASFRASKPLSRCRDPATFESSLIADEIALAPN